MDVDDRKIRLQLWDTAGQERFRGLIPSYIRDSHVALVTYDITNHKSFENTDQWIADVRSQRGNDVIIFLVGNKTDLANKREVTTEEAAEKARALEIRHMEISAHVGNKIMKLFQEIALALPGMADEPAEEVHGMFSGRLCCQAQLVFGSCLRWW